MATGSKFPHELQDGDVFFHMGAWLKADFISIGRPSTDWVTIHIVKEPGEAQQVIMRPANQRVPVILQPSDDDWRRLRHRVRRNNIRNKLRRY